MSTSNDTIVATATPPGVGGIGIVRLSGDAASRIATQMLGELPAPRQATLKSFCDERGQPIDRGLALYFPAPRSFTGEDVVELHGHGGPVIMSMLVDAAVSLGARRAEPGEFSKRAFLNERLDLAQAEAIADLIGAGTTQAARAALRSLSGDFSDAVNDLVAKLTRLRVHVEAAIDFPEEEIDFLSDERLRERVTECGEAFERLQRHADAGRVLRDGYQVVIVGKPNAGKSSLMNRLSGEDTAIVTEVAGTTRDILREHINIDGLAVELVDTAGLRENPDIIEAEGIRRAREAMAAADAVVWLQDATAADDREPQEILPPDVPIIKVRNKADLLGPAPQAGEDTLYLSAKTGAGIEALRRRIASAAGHSGAQGGTFTARRRHVEALARAAAHFAAGRSALEASRAGELFAEELRLAQDDLAAITGAVSSDDLLGQIFASFCIGK